ncbi:MFS transporter [Paenibacillus radicis (ex Xue et al. 2023)]|uniref:MFS transporter n=1 Tax=Paenibacillus radicis (ex Xue et al. 2023) TaxID=2972489 RepID=A0ABT1YFK2_9BACL|nr:MFS transporter [Paenibacillus radicis (ex Xue et al. 2023)]MCR8631975.1 MFS transporter [Paenibacillus radicis (ex Xue et al. 2023)]
MKNSCSSLIFFLALGIFGIITTEMGMIGVLPQVTQKFHIAPSEAGYLVSAFALIVAITGPFLTLLASGMNRKAILLSAILMFAISNLVYAYTTRFEVMLAFRIVPAFFHPVFFSIALATAASLVPPEKSGKAVTRVMAGVTVGFAFGVPITSYLSTKISLEAAFLFGAIVSVIAFIGILVWLPSMPVKKRMSFGKQLGILRKPQLWLTILIVVIIFTAMSSVYSYFAEYLGEVTQMNGTWISVMLMIFGVTMIAGNFLFGFFLNKSMTKTVILFPLGYAVIYLFIYYWGSHFWPMAVIVFVWGAVHSGGLILSQALLMTDAKEAPEFGNSLFVSFSNVGITVGTWIGGLFISQLGEHQLIWSGIILLLFAFLLIMIKAAIFKSHVEKVSMN